MQPGDLVQLGTLKLSNRFVFAPVKTSLAAQGGVPGDESERFYSRIAKGGAALVTLEPAAVDKLALEHPKQLRLFDDSRIESIAKLISAIHENGAKAMVHLNHPGKAANPKAIGEQPVAPSLMECPVTGAKARELSAEEIEKIPGMFASAARRAVSAGADAIEVQFGHGYLLSQFFSSRTNKRQDEWGGDEQARLHLSRLVLEGVNVEAGALPVLARISGKEFVEGGLEPWDMVSMLEMFEEQGIAAVHVGMGNACDSPAWYFHHMSLPQAAQEQVFSAIRKMTSLKIIAVGRLGSPARVHHILDENFADMIALGRPLLADPDFVTKVLEGKGDDIAYCGACLQTCLAHVKTARPISCALNPWTTLESAQTADRPRKVLVVGGGPAGMGAALGAAERGHDVELVEQGQKLGGQFALAVKAPGKKMMEAMVRSLSRRVEKSGVKVTSGTKADAEFIEERAPDVVVLAHGPHPRVPEIPGIHDQYLLTGVEYFENPDRVHGDRILIIGAGMVGMEAAEQLLGRAKQVVATKRGDEIASDMDPMSRALMNKRLSAKDNLKIMTGTTVMAFEKDLVRVKTKDDESSMEAFDTVICAAGMEPDESLSHALSGLSFEIHTVGDAKEPATIEQAFGDGILLGRSI